MPALLDVLFIYLFYFSAGSDESASFYGQMRTCCSEAFIFHEYRSPMPQNQAFFFDGQSANHLICL